VRDIFFAKLSRKEKESALKEAGPEDLASTIVAIRAKYLNKKDRWYSSEKSETLSTVVEGFVSFAEVFTNVVEAILQPAPPEYRAAFAILNFVYKACSNLRRSGVGRNNTNLIAGCEREG
jgi:hypothetical protein